MSDIIQGSERQDDKIDTQNEAVRQLGVRFQRMSGPAWLSLSDKITSDHITIGLQQLGKSQEN